MDELFSLLQRPFNGTWDVVESNMEVFQSIMSKLPVRSILKFKSVSNLWKDAMSTKYFIILHRWWSMNNAKFLAYYDAGDLLDGIVRAMHLMEQNGTYSESYTIPEFESIYNPQIIASFNGLICCMNDVSSLLGSYDVELRICNPATREVLVLPRSYMSVYMPTFGVLYSNETHIYKIFKFFSEPIDNEMGYTQCEVYSSETGEWDLLGWVSSHPQIDSYRPLVSNHVCINEKLYWFLADEENYDIPSSILMVDMDNNFEELALPSDAEMSFLIDFRGRLCFVDWTGRNIYLWLYDESNYSWYLKNILLLPVNWLEISHFDSVAAHKDEILFVYKDVVGLRHELLYNVRNATWEEFHIAEDAIYKTIVVFPFFETLLPCNTTNW